MERTEPSESPLARTGAGRAVEAFELLGNETRLAILVALWEAYDPFAGDDAVRFSELRERVGTGDSGQFNYHLDRLDGHFVEATDGGYRLREAGLTFVRSVIAGAGIEEPSFERAEVDMECGLCGGTVEVLYDGEWVYNVCTECEGLWTDAEAPEGHLSKFKLDPAGFTDRSAGEVYAAAWVRAFQNIYSMVEGVCPSCSGPVEGWLERCETHDESSEGICDDCGRRAALIARLRCPVCKDWAQSTLGGVTKYHPALVAFHYDHGLGLQYGFNDLASINRRLETGETDAEVRSENPLRVRVTVEIDGETAWVELDEELTVVDASD